MWLMSLASQLEMKSADCHHDARQCCRSATMACDDGPSLMNGP